MEEISEDITIFFFAGRDTMAHTLQMLVYYLCKHDNYKKQIQDEIESLKGDFSVGSINSLPMLDATLKETLRHYGPTTTILPKVAMESHSLINGKITIKEGTIVSLGIQELHYDPLYYPDPHRFFPERWFNPVLKSQ